MLAIESGFQFATVMAVSRNCTQNMCVYAAGQGSTERHLALLAQGHLSLAVGTPNVAAEQSQRHHLCCGPSCMSELSAYKQLGVVSV